MIDTDSVAATGHAAAGVAVDTATITMTSTTVIWASTATTLATTTQPAACRTRRLRSPCTTAASPAPMG